MKKKKRTRQEVPQNSHVKQSCLQVAGSLLPECAGNSEKGTWAPVGKSSVCGGKASPDASLPLDRAPHTERNGLNGGHPHPQRICAGPNPWDL